MEAVIVTGSSVTGYGDLLRQAMAQPAKRCCFSRYPVVQVRLQQNKQKMRIIVWRPPAYFIPHYTKQIQKGLPLERGSLLGSCE